MEEQRIERTLVREVKKRGGLALKFVSPGFRGVPDRILLAPEGRIAFAEVKAPGKKPRPLQIKISKMIKSLGFEVYVIDSDAGVDKMIQEIFG